MKKVTSLLLVITSLIISVNVVHRNEYSIGQKPIQSSKTSIYGDYLASSYAQKMGAADFAIEFMESALAKEPDNKELLNRSYGIFIYNGDFSKALDYAKHQIELDKSLLAENPKADINPNPYLVASVDAFKNKRYSEVSSILKPILNPLYEPKSHIDGVILPMIAAWSDVASKKFNDAFKVIDGITSNYMLSVFSYHRALINDIANNKPVEINGKKYDAESLARDLIPDIFTEIGKYTISEKNYEEAVIYFRFADYLGESDEVKTLLATAFEAQEKYENSIKVLQTIPGKSPIYQDAQIAIALDKYRLKNKAEAEKLLNSLADKAATPQHAYKALLVLAGIQMEEKSFQSAIDTINKALQKDPKESPEKGLAYFNQGICYDKLGNWEEAEKNLQQALKLQPRNPEFLNYLAYSWIIKGKNIDESKKMLEEAIINSGGEGHILDSYGWALFKLGEYKKALTFLEQASGQMPYNPVVNDHLGDTYWKLGRKKEAMFQWKKAVENFKPEFEEVDLNELKRKASDGLDK